MKRIVLRTLPSGEQANVQPYHISMKGLKTAILCRDEEDYGVLVKYIAICSHRKNVIVIIYTAVSNHCHIAVLAKSYVEACEFAEELKRIYAQWIHTKYREKNEKGEVAGGPMYTMKNGFSNKSFGKFLGGSFF